ncbi:MAG: helix-hairpin-helix domain-containing protein [Flavobacteriales bacterium]|nr:helix-hairpin-helix domain-containing protein [Flavobacteriales bacterium]
MSGWKDYFTFDKRQRNGVIILLLLIALAIILRLFLPFLFQKEKEAKSNFESQVLAFEASAKKEASQKFKDSNQETDLFDFNPNHLSKKKWLLLGLKDWQINVIHNYESKGGVFRTKADVKKMYGIKEEQYDRLEPYIRIPSADIKELKIKRFEEPTLFQFNPNNLSEAKWKMLGLKDWQIKIIYNYESKGGSFQSKEDVGKIYGIKPEMYEKWKPYIMIPLESIARQTDSTKQLEWQLVELNSADSLGLVSVRGIGPTYAKRILKYRYRLGGYLKLQQLQEVYGITEENYPNIAAQLQLDTTKMNKININECNWGRLVGHPYINENVANSLINYRKNHGLYSAVKDIQNSDLVNEELYLKIAPYLKIE